MPMGMLPPIGPIGRMTPFAARIGRKGSNTGEFDYIVIRGCKCVSSEVKASQPRLSAHNTLVLLCTPTQVSASAWRLALEHQFPEGTQRQWQPQGE